MAAGVAVDQPVVDALAGRDHLVVEGPAGAAAELGDDDVAVAE